MALLEKAAIEAMQQWQYASLLLNGTPERFVVTVMDHLVQTSRCGRNRRRRPRCRRLDDHRSAVIQFNRDDASTVLAAARSPARRPYVDDV
jgi:hypothetical protein